MESCESPVISGTDDGLSLSTSQQQQCPSQPWNSLSNVQVPPGSQTPSLEPLSLSASYPSKVQGLSVPHKSLKEQQQSQSPPVLSASSIVSAIRHQQSGTLGLQEEDEGVGCGEEEDEELDDLDEMEIDGCFPSLLPIDPEEGAMPTLVRQRQVQRRGMAESGSEEEEGEESSDVENLAGEIVYQPDGSAYVVESLSQLIQSDGGAVSSLLPANSLPGMGMLGETAGTSPSVYPQIINTFHIASSFAKWFGPSDQGFPSTSSLAGLSPVLHSFRVFDVRHKSNKDYLNSDGSAKKSCVSKDVPNNVDFSKFDGLALYGKGKPILMCFLCKLSFGYARSFVTHAVHDHRMTLNENERRLLGHKHASAIIQGIGKDKEPLISFLEPKNRSSPSPPTLMPLSSGQSFYGTFSGVHLDPGSNGRGSEALLSKDSDLGLKQSPLGPLLTLGALGSPKSSSLTSVSDPAKDSSAQPPQSGRADGLARRDGTPRGGDRERDSGEGRGLVRSMEAVSGGEEVSLEEGEDEEGAEGPPKACGSSGSVGGEGGRPAVSNQSVSKSLLLMPSSSLQPSGRCPAASPTHAGRAASSASSSSRTSEGGASADDGGRSSEPPFSFNCQGASLPMPGAATTSRGGKDDIPACSPGSASPPLPPHAASDESANQDSATAPEPNHSPAEGEEDSGALLHHHHHLHHHLHPHGHGHSHPHPGMPCDLTGVGECPQNHGAGGSGVECPKCDTVLGSSRSLGGHMTMMHSRNSCKTLKCPKCNWHYKYQQTLEAHMKEKHPDSGGSCMYCSTGQSHPRLARGESYTCGYKPFRCEVCNYSTTTKGNLSIHMQSDKHLNNMQTLQNGGSVPASGEQVFGHAPGGVVPVPPAAQPPVHPHHPAQSAGHVGGACGAPSPTKPKSKPMWRCEVCDYETNVARNLRIHMTSEKHMHNVMLLQQNVAQIQHGRLGLGGLPSPSEAELYQYYLSQNMNLSPGLKMDPSGADAQFLLSGFHLDPSMVALGPSLGGDIPMDMRLAGGPLVSEELMTLGESLSQTSDPSLKLFQCAVCNRFTTDNLDVLGLHMGAERTLPEDEWRATVGDSHQCKLCRYTTQLKANFQLHCKTDKHVQKYQLVAHIKEGGKGNEWRLKCVAIGNPVHLKCNACDYYTNSLEKLRLHTVSSRHEASLKLYKHLQQHESAVEGDTGYYHCALCNYSTKAKLNLIQHVRSMKHQRCESLHKLQRLQKGLPEEEDELGTIFTIVKCPSADTGELSEDVEAAGETAADQEDQTKDRESGGEKETSRAPAACVQAERDHTDSPVSSKRPPSKSAVTEGPLSSKCPKTAEKSTDEQTQVYQCPYCKYSNGDLNRMRMHVMTQHSVQPLFRCPLCQDMLNSKVHLQLHLTHLHSVAPDCVNKLIASVTPSEVLPESMLIPVPGPERDGQTASQNITNSGLDLKKQTDALETECEKRPLQLTEIAEAHKSTLEEQSTKEDTAGFLCWKKGCSQVFKSSSALQLHFGEVHNKRPQLPVSERHVYKYRCNQCSLAFKTVEKLQLHSQYHVIRAATMCCLCQRSFRTLQALKKHLETSHLELSDADIQQLYGGLLMNGDLMVIGDTSPGEDQGALGEDDREGEESEPDEKQSPIGSDSGSIQEDAGSEPKRALPFRKGPNFTMEKFLDPSRPFKCTVCKESFTQKNILLVHYNSVSHLHKVKRALQESSAGQPELTNSPDNKPFKCSTCSVAYSQSSTLEIHMRSVLHQTKARAAKLEAAGGSSCSVSSVSGSGSGSAVGISNPNPNSTATSTATSSNSSSTSSVQTVQSILGGNHMNQTHSTESPGNASVPSNPRPPENSDSKKKKFPDMLSSRGQQQHLQHQQLAQAQAQAQLQQELQQQAALIQSQLFNPALLQHFPMATEALLQLQQQQLLFPFYIPGAEFQLNPEMNLNSSALSLASSSANSLLEDLKNSAQQVQQSCLQQQLLHHHLQQQHQPQAHSQATSQMALLQQNASLLHQGEKKPKSFLEKDCDGQKEKELNEKGEDHSSKDSLENTKSKDKKDQAMVSGNPDPNFLPPRIASDARGNATKALLENFGFELVIQYNENKQKVQKKSSGSGHVGCNGPIGVTRVVDPVEGLEKLECEACGKLFSNILILKSHQEHIHQAFFPFHSLERFAKEYREQYDKLYPLRPQTPEAAPPPAPPPLPPPPPPPQRASTPNIPVSAPSLTPPAIPAPQPPVSMTQIPMPMDLPIFPPIMMQSMSLQSIPTQVPAHLPSVEPSLASDLAQLYQQQLTPAMLQQQQQNKRPRTRITDDQLRVLRQYFDINNSPNEDQVKEMADKSGLPQKVIKHWFRNTLFKERQRNKDSPYNFNNPPITTLEETKVDSKPPSPEPQRYDYYGSKRSSRTRFTDYQLRVLQDFFDTNAYPKDDEFEQLSNLLNLPTRVIVVWFQNARQKARKNYENQGEGAKEGDRRELSNDRYIRTTNLNYQCKKCSLVFQRIFDLIKHQKKLCYKDEDDEGLYDSQNEDSVDFSNECYTPTGPSSSSLCPFSSSTSAFSHNTSSEKDEASPSHVSHSFGEKSKQSGDTSEPREDQRPIKQESLQQPQSETQLQRLPRDEQTQATPKTQTLLSPTSQQKQQTSPSVSQASPAPLQSSHMILNPVLPSASQQQPQQLSQQIVPYHCEQCKLGFPSFEHWQEHQQLHFLTVQNQFIHPQFLDRTMDMPFMLFDPSNPLLASQLFSGTMPQISAGSTNSPTTPPSTLNSLKRKLEEKPGISPGENDSANSGEEPQRDKRLRTTITPEQLEILYQKYLLDSNPTRKMLDHIAHEVGLKKRVVQVWFQNTRARERKGQFRAVGPAQAHRRCPFCRALFKAKTALEAHIRSRHWHEAKRAGYSLALASMLPDQEGKLDPLDISSFSQHISLNNDGHCSLSPVSKSMDLLPHALLSPGAIKVEGIEDFESPAMSSVNLTFDQNKLDNDDCSSVNTAITDTTTGDEAIADNDSSDAKQGHYSNDFLSKSGGAVPSLENDFLSKSGGAVPSLENDDQMSSELVSPATSSYAKDFENETVVDYSETSSLADPCSPSPGASGSRSIDSGDRPGQKRFRTQMTNLQLKLLKSCFNDYRTPTMLECEVLGSDIGLPKRVVQVWFQNARAKEKKAKLSMAKHFGINQTPYEGPKTECTLCGVKYSARTSVRDHIFSQQHISKVKETIGNQLDKEKEYFDPATVRQLMAQQEIDRIKKANEVLGLAQQQAMQQPGMFDNPALQALNLSSAYPTLQGIPPVLLPGVGNPSLPGFTSSNTALTPPKPPNLNMPGSSVPSLSLPTSGLPNKPPTSSSLASPSPVQTSNSTLQSTPTTTSTTMQLGPRPEHPSPERLREKEKPKDKSEKLSTPSSTGVTPAPSTSAANAKKDKADTAVLATSMLTPGMEYVVDPAQLQALQAALGSDPTALLTSQFLPYFMPGFSPYYSPQIPGALQGGYLQPMYSMESLFPYNPALSQALMGLSPGSLLQHYQQYQQSLQEALQQQQQQRQLQQQQKQQQVQLPKASQTPTSHQPPGTPDCKEFAKDGVKGEEQKGIPSSEASSSSHKNLLSEQQKVNNKGVDPFLEQYIVPKVPCRLACRKCQAVFTKEEVAIGHLKSICFFGQSVSNPQELLLRVPSGGNAGDGSLYDCLVCNTTLDGDKVLSQHLESALHKHRTIKRTARNAKEHATSLLPLSSACFLDPDTTSTSQSATLSNNSPPPLPVTSATMPSSSVSSSSCSSSSTATSPHTAAGKPWAQAPSSRALARKPNSASSLNASPFPPGSSPSTVTSSSLSTSGVQTSIPTDVFTDESDSESSQRSAGRMGHPAEEAQQPSCLKDNSCNSNLASV